MQLAIKSPKRYPDTCHGGLSWTLFKLLKPMKLHIDIGTDGYEVSMNFMMSKLLIIYRINLLCGQNLSA